MPGAAQCSNLHLQQGLGDAGRRRHADDHGSCGYRFAADGRIAGGAGAARRQIGGDVHPSRRIAAGTAAVEWTRHETQQAGRPDDAAAAGRTLQRAERMLRPEYQRNAGGHLRLPDNGYGYGNRRERGGRHKPDGDSVSGCTTVRSRARGFVLAALLLPAAGAWMRADAQALPAGTGTGMYVIVGGTFSEFQSDWGKQDILGGGIYVDTNLFWRWGQIGRAS